MSNRRLLLTVLVAGWAAAFVYAFYHFVTTAPTGDSFARGLNRISGYLGWQAIAGAIAIAVIVAGRSWPKRSAVRRLSWVPFGLAMAHVAAIAGLILWANLA